MSIVDRERSMMGAVSVRNDAMMVAVSLRDDAMMGAVSVRTPGCRPEADVKRFRGGLVFKAHRWLYHSTLGSRVIKKKRRLTEASLKENSHLSFRALSGRLKLTVRRHKFNKDSLTCDR